MQDNREAQLEEIGRRIREVRQSKRLSQRKVAETLGMSFQSFQAYESGKVAVSVPRLIEIARSLGVTLEELLPTGYGSKRKRTVEELVLTPAERQLVLNYRCINAPKSRALVRDIAQTLAEHESKRSTS